MKRKREETEVLYQTAVNLIATIPRLVRITCSKALEARISQLHIWRIGHGEVPMERHVLCWVTAARVEKHIFPFLLLALLLGLVAFPGNPEIRLMVRSGVRAARGL